MPAEAGGVGGVGIDSGGEAALSGGGCDASGLGCAGAEVGWTGTRVVRACADVGSAGAGIS